METRFSDANTHSEACEYFRAVARQSLWRGWNLPNRPQEFEWGVRAHFVNPAEGEFHLSCTLPQWYGSEIEGQLRSLQTTNVGWSLVKPWASDIYALAEWAIGNRRAKRSGAWYMNHVDEGIYILTQLKATRETIDAFIWHAFTQTDEDLARAFKDRLFHTRDPVPLVLAMEYRNIANQYLASSPPRRPSEFASSPLPQIQQMLVADKVQNRKDFERFHKGTHPNSARLEAYFAEWFEHLGVSEERYQELIEPILILDRW